MKLGDVATMDLPLARARCQVVRAGVANGEDPAQQAKVVLAVKIEERQRERSLAEFAAEYCTSVDKWSIAPKGKRDEKRHIGQALELSGAGELPPGELRSSHVMRLLDAAEGPALPRKLLASLSNFCTYLVDRNLLLANPVALIARRHRPKPPKARTRVLALEEVGTLWNAAGRLSVARGQAMDKAAWSRLARFALLIPARVGEISVMRWGNVDLKAAVWEQPARTTKNGDAHALPLPPAALGLLEEQRAVLLARGLGFGPEDPVWVGPKSGKPIYQHWGVLLRRLREASGVRTWSWHDIRRTVVTHLAEHGVAESVADALLNHRQSATRGGVLGVYQRANRHPERRQALEIWQSIVEEAARQN